MKPSDFFTWAQFPEPFGTRSVLDAEAGSDFVGAIADPRLAA